MMHINPAAVEVDYESGRWSVTLPDGTVEDREAKL